METTSVSILLQKALSTALAGEFSVQIAGTITAQRLETEGVLTRYDCRGITKCGKEVRGEGYVQGGGSVTASAVVTFLGGPLSVRSMMHTVTL